MPSLKAGFDPHCNMLIAANFPYLAMSLELRAPCPDDCSAPTDTALAKKYRVQLPVAAEVYELVHNKRGAMRVFRVC